MATRKEFDFVTTFATVDGIKKKKLQAALDAALAEILNEEDFQKQFVDEDSTIAMTVTNVSFSEIRKIEEDTPETPEVPGGFATDQELVETVAKILGADHEIVLNLMGPNSILPTYAQGETTQPEVATDKVPVEA